MHGFCVGIHYLIYRGSAMGLTYYIPAIIVEISVFNYTYKTSKE